MPINLPSVWRDEDEPDFFTRDEVGADPTLTPDPTTISGDPEWPTCAKHGITYHVSSSCSLCRFPPDEEEFDLHTVEGILDHLAHLDDDVVDAVRDGLNAWVRAAHEREERFPSTQPPLPFVKEL